jgi:hypothetical protein
MDCSLLYGHHFNVTDVHVVLQPPVKEEVAFRSSTEGSLFRTRIAITLTYHSPKLPHLRPRFKTEISKLQGTESVHVAGKIAESRPPRSVKQDLRGNALHRSMDIGQIRRK